MLAIRYTLDLPMTAVLIVSNDIVPIVAITNLSPIITYSQVCVEDAASSYTSFVTSNIIISQSAGQYIIVHETSQTYADQLVINDILFEDIFQLADHIQKIKAN